MTKDLEIITGKANDTSYIVKKLRNAKNSSLKT